MTSGTSISRPCPPPSGSGPRGVPSPCLKRGRSAGGSPWLSTTARGVSWAWLAAEDSQPHDTPRAVVDSHGEPPAERPHLRQGEGTPRGPEPEGGGHGREIDVPEVIHLSGGDGARGYLVSRAGDRRSLPQHPAHCRGTEVETCTGEDLGDLDHAKGGAEDLEAPDEVADEVG